MTSKGTRNRFPKAVRMPVVIGTSLDAWEGYLRLSYANITVDNLEAIRRIRDI